jgi:hypothetical protein
MAELVSPLFRFCTVLCEGIPSHLFPSRHTHRFPDISNQPTNVRELSPSKTDSSQLRLEFPLP